MLSSNSLAIQRTKFSNQRTYLAYMRTGFAIASIAGTFKKIWIAFFGIIMIIGSIIQYILINNNLNIQSELNNSNLDSLPIIYVILSFGALYLQMNN